MQSSSAPRSKAPTKHPALVLATLGMLALSFGRMRVGEWTLSDLLFVMSGLAVMADRLLPRQRTHSHRAPRSSVLSPTGVGTLVLLTGATTTSLVALDPLGSMIVTLKFVWLSLIWIWILQNVAPDTRRFDVIVSGLRWTIFISCTVAVAGHLGLVSLSEKVNETRETGLFDHPNHLGGILVVGLPFIVLGLPVPRTGERSAVRRLLETGFVLLAMTTTGSITSMIGAFVALLTLGCTLVVARGSRAHQSSPLRYLMALFASVVVIGYLTQSSTPVAERLQSLGNEGTDVSTSAESREEHVDAVISNLDDLLIVGMGLDKNSAIVSSERSVSDSEGSENAKPVHNVYLRLLHDAGLPALLGFLLIVLISLRNTWLVVLHSRGTRVYGTAVALISSLVAINVVAQFRTTIYERYFWLPIVLAATLWAAYRNDLARDAAVTREAAPTRMLQGP